MAMLTHPSLFTYRTLVVCISCDYLHLYWLLLCRIVLSQSSVSMPNIHEKFETHLLMPHMLRNLSRGRVLLCHTYAQQIVTNGNIP